MSHSTTIKLALCLLLFGGCNRPTDTAKKPTVLPAEVARHVTEESLNTIVLSEKAVERLGIRTAEIAQTSVRRRRTYGGEVVVPPGQTIVVSAPVPGTLEVPPGGQIPSPGARLSVGQSVVQFRPMLTHERDVLTPSERVQVARSKSDLATLELDAERRVVSAEIEVEAAQIAYDRAVDLLESRAGSKRSVELADAQLRLARKALETAVIRHKFLAEVELDEEAGKLASRSIEAPVSGILQRMDVAAGETVAAGAPLFQVMQLNQVWIRVPVYVGDWHRIETGRDASIREYGRAKDSLATIATPVAAPPSADPVASTVDLFYAVKNDGLALFPGQKVEVTLTCRDEEQSLVLPWAAVLYDVHGSGWVYEQVAPRTYARRRVEVKFIDGPNAVAAFGPSPGTVVVTDGAAELYGTEFGAGK